MQLVNASVNGYGATVQLSANTTWTYPFPPGQPPKVLYRQLSVCVPSNITIASACCKAANGSFVSQSLANTHSLNSSQIAQLPSGTNPSGWVTGDLVPANATWSSSYGSGINWCSLPWSPTSNTWPSNYTTVSLQSGQTYSTAPQSVLNWIQCFNGMVPASDVAAGRAAFDCYVNDAQLGGEIQGFKLYRAPASGADRSISSGASALVLLLGAAYVTRAAIGI